MWHFVCQFQHIFPILLQINTLGVSYILVFCTELLSVQDAFFPIKILYVFLDTIYTCTQISKKHWSHWIIRSNYFDTVEEYITGYHNHFQFQQGIFYTQKTVLCTGMINTRKYYLHSIHSTGVHVLYSAFTWPKHLRYPEHVTQSSTMSHIWIDEYNIIIVYNSWILDWNVQCVTDYQANWWLLFCFLFFLFCFVCLFVCLLGFLNKGGIVIGRTSCTLEFLTRTAMMM